MKQEKPHSFLSPFIFLSIADPNPLYSFHSMSSKHHVNAHVARHSPPNVRKVPVKAPRSAPSSKTPTTPNITIKLAKRTRRSKDQDDDICDDDDDDMASSFLQFW